MNEEDYSSELMLAIKCCISSSDFALKPEIKSWSYKNASALYRLCGGEYEVVVRKKERGVKHE